MRSTMRSTIRSMMRATWNVGLAAAAAAIALAACEPPATIFRSRADLAKAAPIDRLLVLASLDVDGRVSRGFADALTDRLTACGVVSEIVLGRAAVASLDPAIGAGGAHPTAALVVRSEGGQLTTTGVDFKYGILYFDFQLRDAVSRKPTWVAKAEFSLATHNTWEDVLEGVRLATSVASRLRDDGVLPHCPPASVGWQPIHPVPGCADERRRILVAAMHEANSVERSHMIASAPTCQ